MKYMRKIIIILVLFLVASLIGLGFQINKIAENDIIIDNLDSENSEKQRKLEQLESEISNKDNLISDLEEQNKSLQGELFSINSYSEKYYINGILVESHQGMRDALKACKSKVDDLEYQLRNCQ